MAWQQLTWQWWSEERHRYELFASGSVIAEASRGGPESALRRTQCLEGVPELLVDSEVQELAARLIADGAVPSSAQADALHVAVAAVHGVDYLLTWNCRHIDNAAAKPLMRSVCAVCGYTCAEICTPLELLGEELGDV